jgi:hypothetical protein
MERPSISAGGIQFRTVEEEGKGPQSADKDKKTRGGDENSKFFPFIHSYWYVGLADLRHTPTPGGGARSD